MTQDLQPIDHCWLHAGGHDCRILAMNGLGDITVYLFETGQLARLDLSVMDWPSYIAKAVEFMGWRYTFERAA